MDESSPSPRHDAATKGSRRRAKLRRRARRQLLLIPVFGLVLVVAGWIALMLQLDAEGRRVLDGGMRDTESFAAAFEQYSLRAIHEADRTALLVKDQFERERHLDLAEMTSKGLLAVESLIQLSVTDSAGNVIVSTLHARGTRNMADREYFQLHARSDTGRLDIAKPVIGRVSGKISIPFSRRLNHGNGSFAGIVVLQFNPDYFTSFYRDPELGQQGMLSVIGLDGVHRARRAGEDASFDPDAEDSSFIARVKAAAAGTFENAGHRDSLVRIVSYRVLRDYPIVVSVGQAKDEILAEFHGRRTSYIAIASAASVVILVFFGLITLLALRLKRSHRRAWEAKEMLRAASDSSLDAFFLLRSVRDRSGALTGFSLREINASGEALAGDERARLMGRPLHEVLPAAGSIDKYARVVKTGEPLEEEFQVDAPQAPGRWLRHQVVRVHDGIAITVRDITERKHNEQEVHLQKSFLQTLVHNLPLGVLARRMKGEKRGEIVLWNESCSVIDGVPANRAMGSTLTEILPAETARRVAELDRQMLENPVVQEVSDMPIETPQLGRRMLHVIRAPIFDADNEVEYIVAILRDITDEQARLGEIHLASKVFEMTGDAIVVSDAVDRVIMVNPAFTRLTGFSPEAMKGQLMWESPFRPTDPAGAAARMERLQQRGYVTGEVLRMRQDGSELPCWVTATCVRDKAGQIVNYVRVFTDISQLKDSQRKLHQLATFDPLTGLPNRRLFHDMLGHALERARRARRRLCLLFLDLDGLKHVNDTLGHDAGDELLKGMAARLDDCVRGSDSLCRLGGDEFTVIVENAKLPHDAVRISERIVRALSTPFQIAGREVESTASIGIAVFPDDGSDGATLVKSADVAMYRAKKAGRNRFELFSPRAGAWDPPDFQPTPPAVNACACADDALRGEEKQREAAPL